MSSVRGASCSSPPQPTGWDCPWPVAGGSSAGEGYRVARAGFPWHGLELVVEGHGTLALQGSSIALGPGAIFAYGPGIAHAIHSERTRPLRKYFLDLGGRGAAEALAHARLAPGTAAQLRVTALARGILDLLIEVGCAGGPQAPALCLALARAALLAIRDGLVPSERAQEPAYASYARCRSWLEAHGDEVRTLADAARACGVSAAYLCRLFRRYDVASPWRLVRGRRLQRAAELLEDHRLAIGAIASRIGYGDPFHFSRAFRKQFGIAPRRYRLLRAAR